jgi:hypothetical protein
MSKTIKISQKSDFKKLSKQIKKDLKKDISPRVIKKEVGNTYFTKIKRNVRKFSKTGFLLRSLFKRETKKSFTIYSKAPYAEIQDKGGRIRITDRMRKKMWALYYSTKDSVYKAIAITKKSFINIPAKKYSSKGINFRRIVKSSIKKLTK